MFAVEVHIRRKEGIHARPASLFVKEAMRFKSKISLCAGDTTVNGKSIMGLLMLALSPGNTVKIKAEGSDEHEAVEVLAEILASQ